MKNTNKAWRYRRATMYAILIFSMAIVVLALYGKCDSAAASTAIKMAFGAITIVLSSYIFGATWDDKNRKG